MAKLWRLDAKLNFDENALYRHPEIVELRDFDEEDPKEIEASKYDLSYVSLRWKYRLYGKWCWTCNVDNGYN